MFEKNEWVYISHPYRDNPFKNYLKVRLLMKGLQQLYPKTIFMAAHLYLPHFMTENEHNQDVIKFWYLSLLKMCDTMVLFGTKLSEGMKIEYDYCNSEFNVKGNIIKVINASEELYNEIGVSKNLIEEG